jgi:hypothetical protein
MNTFTKTLILSVAAFATVAGTVEFASAGDRYWRNHHRGHWRGNAVIAGVTAGVVVGGLIAASRPRVVYEEAPVVVEEEPAYDERETVYLDPDEDYDRPVYRERAPADEEYAAPDDRYVEPQGDGYDDDQRADRSDYFPDKPTKRQSQRRDSAGRDYADAGSLKPWTSEWRRYCADRYASFNSSNGTYLGYDQKRHFCKAG